MITFVVRRVLYSIPVLFVASFILFCSVRLTFDPAANLAFARDPDAIEPDHVFTVDIRAASDAALAGLTAAGVRFPSADRADHALGNIKARQRMVAQYGIAAALDGLVIGTDKD